MIRDINSLNISTIGVTFTWSGQNNENFNILWIQQKDKAITAMKNKGLFYDKLTSMKLRASENSYVAIFTK